MRKPWRAAWALPWIAWIVGCGPGPSEKSGNDLPNQPVVIFAAASTINAVEEIKAAFTKQTGASVRTSFAASSTLAQQIEHGADADLFLSADVKWADQLEKNLPAAKRRDLLGNRLVIIAPSDSKLKLAQPEDLLSAEVKHLALGDPAAVPVGIYAKQALTRLGLWKKLQNKVAAAGDVRQALSFVETGAAEAGIVYATDAAISRKVKVLAEIPTNLTEPVRYPLLLLKRAEGNRAAGAFYDYLGSPAAAQVFEKFGFVVLADHGDK